MATFKVVQTHRATIDQTDVWDLGDDPDVLDAYELLTDDGEREMFLCDFGMNISCETDVVDIHETVDVKVEEV